MEIIQYSEEHRMFRESVRKYFEKEVIPYVEEWEEAGIVPRSAWKKLGGQGFLCMDVSEEYGGLGADFLYSVIMTEEMMRTNHGGFCTFLHSDIVVPYITAYGSEELQKKYLPGCISGDIIAAVAMTEPNTGSDLAAIKATAVEDGDNVIINGQKTFISNGINCGIVIVAARDPRIESPYAAMDLYIVEEGTPGFEKGKQIKKVGLHSQDTAELYFTDCRVPKKNRLGEKGTGFLHLMEKLQQERLMVAICAVAAAEYMLDITIDYCKERSVFGKPVSKFQHSQFEIVEMAT
ncbi:MAG: acyl-CoA dehydrogenase family protein, partial [Deltaproteobacteria bacterium]|nr:acyl-CoA dehydrogenase family protein [Deltaproteobacteria bacterium]MBW2596164.1 acyl-CoA dehydrogenase family protein [Deltaproteobacteria bacterium]MBW2650760.1 acyl-CoA dehydrogenase family protein [Deltaproteobacteria bacterium]